MKRELFEDKLIDLFFAVFKEAIIHNRVKRMRTYMDFLYLLEGNCLNCSIIDSARILRQNFYDLSLDKYNEKLSEELDELFNRSLELKKEVYKENPNRRMLGSKNFARLFKSKERKEINNMLKP